VTRYDINSRHHLGLYMRVRRLIRLQKKYALCDNYKCLMNYLLVTASQCSSINTCAISFIDAIKNGQRFLTKGRITPALVTRAAAYVVPCEQVYSRVLLRCLLFAQSNPFQWETNPQNCPFPGDPGAHLIHGSLGPPKSTIETASQSVHPFL